MEIFENKLGYLFVKFGDVDYVMMDGILMGFLMRLLVYFESVKGLIMIENVFGKGKFKEFVKKFVSFLDEYYKEFEDGLREKGKINGNVIFVDEKFEEFEEFYKVMKGYKVRDFVGMMLRGIKIFWVMIDEYLKGRKSVEEIF